MKNILCICSAFKNSLIACSLNGKEFFAQYNSDASCSETMLVNVNDILKKAEISLEEIDEIAVVVGPGSFTGIRIALALVKGFSLALNKIRFIAVSSLKLLAFSERQKSRCNDILAIMDGLSGHYFVCEYHNGEFSVEQCICEDKFLSLLSTNKNSVFIEGETEVKDSKAVKITPKDLLDFSLYLSSKGYLISQNELLPNYLRLSQAEESLLESKKQKQDFYSINEMTEADIDDVYSISFEAFNLESASKNMIRDEFHSEFKKFFVAKENKEVIGFLTFMLLSGEVELLDIAVKKGYQDKGIGSKLLEHLISFCKANNIKNIFLEVNVNNKKAITLYKKYDFKQVSIRKKYYRNLDDALILKKDIL
ncbi:MAG: ribosomal protein S18-alanine N-acetyltransferase [Clostridia bacterium]